MENQKPGSKVGERIPPGNGMPVDASSKETEVVHGRTALEKPDPEWESLGSTRVTESCTSGVDLQSDAQHTELSPSRVLGKNLLRLDDYQLVKKLGEGAMGAVYKAMDLKYKRTVALKVLFPHVANNPKLVERLYREGLVMGKLDHPNIVTAYAVGEAEGCHYVAMEYVAGQNMQKWLNHLGRIPVGDAVRITLECANALKYAHAQNMVHRDIKPDNILLTKNGGVKVADLGMVKTHDEDMSLTQTGHAVGTPWYMPLEQARNAKEIDGRSDIYALGCTLYAMLTGRPPFVGRTIVDVIQAKDLGTFAPARQTNQDVPERLDLIIAKMTARAPKHRYQNCDDVIRDLESLGLANECLSFIQRKPRVERDSDTPIPGKTVLSAPAKPKPEQAGVETPAVAIDQDVWFVQIKKQDGTVSASRYTTAQLQKMLSEGTIAPTARASHDPSEGFRSLATYKEFQGTAMTMTTKKAADKTTARYRGIYKKLEEEDRQRAEKEREAARPESAVQANVRYWGSIALLVVPILVAAIAAIWFLYWLAT